MGDLMRHDAGGRLLLVVPTATSFLAFLTGVTEAWRRRGGLVAVASGPDLPGHGTRPGQAAWPAGIERLPLPDFREGSPFAMLRAVAALREAIGAWQPDIVHAHFAAAVCLAGLARMFSAGRSMAWVGTFQGLHGTAAPGAGKSLVAAVERWSARRMTQVCVVNAEDRLALDRGDVGMPVHLHGSCGLGCDLGRFDGGRFSPGQRDRIRCEAGIPPEAFVLAFVGRQTAFKGFDATVRAHRILRNSGVDATLLIVGAADAAHGSGLTVTERRELDHDPNVVRTGWQQDVAPWLAIADACVLPSVREGMPVCLMESLAMGVPSITVDSRGCRDVVRDGVDGFVLPSAAPEGIADAAARLATDRSLAASMRAAAVAGRGRFDRRSYVEDQIAVYDALLRQSDAARRPSSRKSSP